MKKILLTIVGIVAVAVGVVGMSAYEAHIINVTAHIENALRVFPNEVAFGTVFPQEYFQKSVFITTSSSFCKPDQRRVLNIDYKIVQKPKCVNDAGQYAPVDYTTDLCPSGYREMPSVCAYLSKTPRQIDAAPYTDHGVLPFHNPNDPSSVATGTINKDHDLQDEWVIDLAAPCFEGMCSQDWDSFVHHHNAQANPNDYIVDPVQEGKNFGCDLWVEVTKIY